METKHTPGPWALHPTALHPAVRSVGTPDTGPRRICTVGTMNGNPVDKANARLIAAAPELLAALQALVGWEDAEIKHFGATRPDDWIMDGARAAIAKATA